MLIKKDSLNLIRKIAWSFYNTTGIDWQELFSQASLAYCEAISSYNPKKGKITTYLWSCMKSELLNFIKEENKYRSSLCPLNDIDMPEIYPSQFEYTPISQNERTVNAAKKAMQTEKNTRVLLKTKYGWSDFVIEQAVMDMKILALSTND